MITRHTHDKIEWIDLESPTEEEVRALMQEFSLHPSIAEDLLSPTRRPLVDVHDDYLYLVLHFPALKHTHHLDDDQEVDFIVGKKFIITNRYETIDAFHKFSKLFEVETLLEKTSESHAGYIFFHILRKLYKSIEHELESIRDDLESAEVNIFEGHEKEMVVELSHIGRSILNLRQSLSSHKEALESFKKAGQDFFGKSFVPAMSVIVNDYDRILSRIRTQCEWITELRETNNSLVSTKQNEIMKVLTIMAFITFPLSLISSIFGMNTVYLPVVGMDNDFWFIITGMALLSTFFFTFFWYKKWL